ncbi:hypothetical protein EI42_03105 [Thermosporothrix hazakensis]|jgi:hypothetical protein|uniref:Uncharacterized protein n=1 Tax=Thermosporothrix hazakensis TaxID=644383 RepID=A0A326U6V9_THEHA|nr:hypothetical protein [Thermosporothrix hazakensis]PZW28351.1 hypothetical protein EI42_03105 [Thermosporothrix hazakensis]GCE46290.1 hypothetical protein KTH_11590 [Thermosporothrix hazakensis]
MTPHQQHPVQTILLHGKPSVPVAERLRLLHEHQVPFQILESGPVPIGDRLLWRVVISIETQQYIGNAEVNLQAPKHTPDGTHPFECAETSALGRALAFAGFGLLESIASVEEMARPPHTTRAKQSPVTTPPTDAEQPEAQMPHSVSYPDNQFLDWVARSVERDPTRIARICQTYQVSRLEDLSQAQREHLTRRLKREPRTLPSA